MSRHRTLISWTGRGDCGTEEGIDIKAKGGVVQSGTAGPTALAWQAIRRR